MLVYQTLCFFQAFNIIVVLKFASALRAYSIFRLEIRFKVRDEGDGTAAVSKELNIQIGC